MDIQMEKPAGERKPGRCLIIGAGEFCPEKISSEDFPEEVRLKACQADMVIAVDGGLAGCEKLDLEPDFLIGDFDSVQEEQRAAVQRMEEQRPERVRRLAPEKDDTDMLAALRFGLSRGYRRFMIYGGTGGRLDHTFANIQCLLYLKKQGAGGCLVDDRNILFVLRDGEEICFHEKTRGGLSLFALGQEAEGVSIRGLKYPLTDYIMKNDYPIGVSNEFVGRPGSIGVKRGELLCVLALEA